ncbi:MAG: hypothetical protein K5656_09375, partial [Lachnospiraceae bacterium]|nr:hypothetical protein [Lachnospiraceae bacterium]
MTNAFKKLFGGINLTWPKLIIAAVIAGIFTAAMAIIPAVHFTSFNTITVTLEVWILFGILIIMNSKSNLDSALKCFVFFLISQPLVYLIQVPFSDMGWGLFSYYRFWFIWTILCLPMGFIGYYIKMGKWWGYLILLPMVLITATSLYKYMNYFIFYRPFYILITIFCACAMIFYPVLIFENKKIKITGAIIGAVIATAIVALAAIRPMGYSTEVISSGEEYTFDDSYKVSFADDKYGDIEIKYDSSLEDYVVYADFKRGGKTSIILESPSGEKKEFDIMIKMDT